MAIYPPAKSRSISTANGHTDDFDKFFNELRSRWVKVERLQQYDTPKLGILSRTW